MEPTVSPTGKALVALPAWLAFALGTIAAICAAAAVIPGLPPIVHQIAIAVGGVCTAVLAMSSGARAKPPPVASPQAAADVLSLPPKS